MDAFHRADDLCGAPDIAGRHLRGGQARRCLGTRRCSGPSRCRCWRLRCWPSRCSSSSSPSRSSTLVFVLTGGGPGQATTVSSFYIYRVAIQQFDIGAAAAQTLMFAVVVGPRQPSPSPPPTTSPRRGCRDGRPRQEVRWRHVALGRTGRSLDPRALGGDCGGRALLHLPHDLHVHGLDEDAARYRERAASYRRSGSGRTTPTPGTPSPSAPTCATRS